MKISIIIPIYNTEKYLPRCIESILNQSFRDFELLLINDGSTDGSGTICDAYACKDQRIRVFHKENGGVSSARNVGLNYATGEWIYFVDSDDEVLPDGLQTLVNRISDDIDIVMGGFVEVNVDGSIKEVNKRAERHLSKKQSVITLYGGYGSFFPYCGYLWMRLLRRSIIQEHHLLFDPSIEIKEDSLFLMQYICKSNGMTLQTAIPVYKYHRRSDSAMGMVENSFNPKYVGSLKALVEMKHEVEELFPFYSDPVFVAKQALYSRYEGILELMDLDHIQNDVLMSRLSSIMHEEVGPVFPLRVRGRIRRLFKKARLLKF